jgi:hypothetical protein
MTMIWVGLDPEIDNMIFEQPLIYLKNNLGNKNQIKYVVKS